MEKTKQTIIDDVRTMPARKPESVLHPNHKAMVEQAHAKKTIRGWSVFKIDEEYEIEGHWYRVAQIRPKFLRMNGEAGLDLTTTLERGSKFVMNSRRFRVGVVRPGYFLARPLIGNVVRA